MDIGTFTAAATGLKTAVDITKGILELKVSTKVEAKVAELQRVIISAQSNTLAAQSDQLAVLDKIRKLKGKMAELKAWDSEKKKYELKELASGNFAYALKEAESKGGPVHYICPHCYEEGKKSLLQKNDMGSNGEVLQCFACDTYVVTRKCAFRNNPTKPL